MPHQQVGIHAVCPCNSGTRPCVIITTLPHVQAALQFTLSLLSAWQQGSNPVQQGYSAAHHGIQPVLFFCISSRQADMYAWQVRRYACMQRHIHRHSPLFISPHLTSPRLVSTLLQLISPHLTSSCFTSPHLTSHHTTLPHLTSHRLTFALPLLNSIMSFWCSNPGEPWARASQMSSRECY